MIKYYSNPEKRQTIAVLENCHHDALCKIDKIMHNTNFYFDPSSRMMMERYLMPDTFRVIVTCDPRDEYDFEIGKKIAKERLMKKYYNSLDKRMVMFTSDLAKAVATMADVARKIS